MQVTGGLEESGIDFLQAYEQRQQHERHKVVDQAADDAVWRRQETVARWKDAEEPEEMDLATLNW